MHKRAGAVTTAEVEAAISGRCLADQAPGPFYATLDLCTYKRYNAGSGGNPMQLKLTTVGNSVGIVLPKELLARLRLEKGDVLHVTELADGIKLAPYDPVFAEQMAVAERIMREDRDVLRRLADA
jgi:putative addiction module antidote